MFLEHFVSGGKLRSTGLALDELGLKTSFKFLNTAFSHLK